jgi:hypothetical protein
MLDDLTPEEVVAIVHLTSAAESAGGESGMVLVAVGDEFTTLENIPGMKSLAEKVQQAGEREDVKKYIEEVYGNE